MGTTINGAYDHSDEEIVFVFQNQQRHTVQTCASVDYENGGDAGEIGGNQIGPVALTSGKASPKWSMEIAKHELAQILTKMGNGYRRQTFQILIGYRPVGALLRIDDTVVNGRLTNDGTKSATGDPAMCAIGGKCTKVVLNGIDPFEVNP